MNYINIIIILVVFSIFMSYMLNFAHFTCKLFYKYSPVNRDSGNMDPAFFRICHQ